MAEIHALLGQTFALLHRNELILSEKVKFRFFPLSFIPKISLRSASPEQPYVACCPTELSWAVSSRLHIVKINTSISLFLMDGPSAGCPGL